MKSTHPTPTNRKRTRPLIQQHLYTTQALPECRPVKGGPPFVVPPIYAPLPTRQHQLQNFFVLELSSLVDAGKARCISDRYCFWNNPHQVSDRFLVGSSDSVQKRGYPFVVLPRKVGVVFGKKFEDRGVPVESGFVGWGGLEVVHAVNTDALWKKKKKKKTISFCLGEWEESGEEKVRKRNRGKLGGRRFKPLQWDRKHKKCCLDHRHCEWGDDQKSQLSRCDILFPQEIEESYFVDVFCFVLFCFVLFCFVLFCFDLICFVCWPNLKGEDKNWIIALRENKQTQMKTLALPTKHASWTKEDLSESTQRGWMLSSSNSSDKVSKSCFRTAFFAFFSGESFFFLLSWKSFNSIFSMSPTHGKKRSRRGKEERRSGRQPFQTVWFVEGEADVATVFFHVGSNPRARILNFFHSK